MRKLFGQFKVILLISGKSKFYKVLLFLIFASLFELGGIGLLYPYLDFLLNPSEIFNNPFFNFLYEKLSLTSTNTFLFYFGIVTIMLVLLSSGIGAYSRILVDRYIWAANILLIRLSYKRYIEKSYIELKKLNSNNITNDIITEVSVFVNGLMVPVFDIIPRVIVLLLAVVFLLFINIKVALTIFVVTTIIYFGIFQIFRNRLAVMSEKRFEMQQALFDYVNSSIRAVKDIKVNNSQDFFIEKVEKPASSYSKLNMTISIFSQMPRYLLESFVFTAAVIVILVNLSHGSITKIIPILSLYAIAAIRLIPHIQGLFTSIAKIKFNIKALEIISLHLSKKDEQKLKEIAVYDKFKEIKTVGVCFGFNNSTEPLLNNVDFKVKEKDFVVIVGKSGSGKSTFIEILLGLIPPSEGNVFLNGKKINRSSVLSARLNIGYVSQEVILFEGTLKENIMLYKNRDVNSEWLNKVIEITFLNDIIESIGGNIECKLFEGGKNLSMGQRQRVAIARSIFNNPQLLFLDEATSALDPKTELSIILNIKKLGIGVILITHNPNLIAHADATYELINRTLQLKPTALEII